MVNVTGQDDEGAGNLHEERLCLAIAFPKDSVGQDSESLGRLF
jgi:hypothetical protein